MRLADLELFGVDLTRCGSGEVKASGFQQHLHARNNGRAFTLVQPTTGVAATP